MSEEMTANIETIKPDAIINCAALTDVDHCEKNILQAAVTNAASVEWLSYRFPGYLIQISTDYVFDGETGPYGVRNAPNPINIYGWSKRGGELAALRHRGLSLIIRTTILFSSTNNNFVAKIVKQLRGNNTVKLYSPGIVGTPTYVPALAAEILRIVGVKYEGVAHIAGTPGISRLGFARSIAEFFGYDLDRIRPIYLHHDKPIALMAPRPKRAGLISDHNGYRPIITSRWKDGLLELSKQKGIYRERPMERMAAGRPGFNQ
jgi:dTDP-4-dehydrorhamnose reductase